MKTVFLDFKTVSNNDIDTSRLDDLLSDVAYHDVTAPSELAPRVADAEVIVTNKIRIDREVMDASPKLKLIALVATGINNVDLDTAKERDVAVCNIRAYCTEAVVQHVFAMLLALTQHLDGYQKLLKEGAWRDAPQFCLLNYPIMELKAKKFGIVGFGELGRAAAYVAAGFGMRVLIANREGTPPREGRLVLDELLAESDVISLHCPLTPETEKMISEPELRLMKPTAILINTARGGLIDSQALADALRAGEIAGAGIDVLPQEPPVDGNPLLADDIPNLIVTPHIAWGTREVRQRAIDEVTANIEDFLRGGTRNRVV